MPHDDHPTVDPRVVSDTYQGAASRGCANPRCTAVLAHLDACMLDQEAGFRYCVPCGQRLRYHRRKALERGEPLLQVLPGT